MKYSMGGKIFKRLSVLIGVTILLAVGYIAFGHQVQVNAEEEISYVDLYKNGDYVARYDNVNAAFDAMTVADADYTLGLSGEQVLTGYEQWPTVKSITITVATVSTDEYGFATPLVVDTEVANINCDVHLKDWVALQGNPMSEKLTQFNLGNHTMTIDDANEHYVNIKEMNIVGDEGSKIVADDGVQCWGAAVNVETVEERDGFLWLLGNEKAESHIKNWYSNDRVEANGFVKIDNLYAGDSGWLQIEDSDAEIVNIYAEGINIYVCNKFYVDLEWYNQLPKITGEYVGNINVYVTEYFHDKFTRYAPSMDISKLLYAPNIDSDVTLYYRFVGSVEDMGLYFFESYLEKRNGYYGYYNELPEFDIDGRVLHITSEGSYTKEYAFSDADNIKNITFSAKGYYGEDMPSGQIELNNTDNQLTINVKNIGERNSFKVDIVTEYTYGTLYNSIIVFVVDPVQNAEFDQSYVEFNDGYFNNYSYVLNLTYDKAADTSKENVIIYVTDTGVISFDKIETEQGYRIGVSAMGCGYASIIAYVNDKLCECKFKVDMPVGEYDADNPNGEWDYNYISQEMLSLDTGDKHVVKMSPKLALLEIEYEPYDISFEAGDSSILLVEDYNKSRCYVTGVKPGTTTLTIRSNDFVKVIPVVVNKVMKDGWNVIDGIKYWYEDDVRQGYDPDNSDYRGKEIYDPSSDAWYWLDNVQLGAVAKSKDVYQESLAGEWGDKTNEAGEKIGKWVRYDENGHMIKGWSEKDGNRYYFDLTYGTMAKGEAVIDGQTYYFDRNTGVLIGTGNDAAKDDDGKVLSDNGWHKVGGVNYWYENGVRQGYAPDNSDYRGKEIYDPLSDAWYWLDNVQDGAVAESKDVYQESLAGPWGDKTNEAGERIGKWVRYDENGHMVKGWDTNEKGTYYFDPVYGTMAKGEAVIDGQTYYFDVNTGVLQ